MARLKGPPPPRKSIALKTGLNIYANRGALVAAKWPRKRGSPKSPVTREQNEWFRQANLLAKYADGQSQWMAIEVSRGSPWYPRDLLISAMKGRLFETLTIDGVEFRSVAIRDDVSSDLDFLAGKVTGTIIVRGADLWSALIPGTKDHVLTSTGPGLLPEYAAGGGGGSPAFAEVTPLTSVSTSAFATKGIPITPLYNYTITSLGTQLRTLNGFTFRGSIFEVDSARMITAIVAETADIVAVGTDFLHLQEALLAPVTLLASKHYVLCWTRRDGGDNFVLRILNGRAGFPMTGMPEKFFAQEPATTPRFDLAKQAPAIGDTFSTVITSGYYMTALLSL